MSNPKPHNAKASGHESKRALYLVLLTLDGLGLGLCNACRFAEWSGPCDMPDLDCKHPLGKSAWGPLWSGGRRSPGDVWSGDDCWGFRPKYDIETVADIAGVYLQGHEGHKIVKENHNAK